MRSFMQLTCAAVIMVLSISAVVSAASAFAAPEVDVTSLGAGVGVLAAGVLMMKSRRGSRK